MRILYVTPAPFTHPNAASLRNVGLSLALAEAGHQVTIATPDPADAEFAPDWGDAPGGVSIVRAGPPGSVHPTRRRAASLIGHSHGRLGALFAEHRPDVVILYQSYLPMLLALAAASRSNDAAFVLDVTEWYDGPSLPLGRFGPLNVMNQASMHLAVPRVRGAITISRPLAHHCGRHGARTIVVPPLFDLGDSAASLRTAVAADPLTIAVTGSGITPGQKDRLGLLAIAEAATSIDPDGSRLRVRVAGVAREVVEAQLPGPVPASFDIMGTLRWKESLGLVANADYTLLLRDPGQRRLLFGFPSKVPESLLLGTPILGNAIGDLATYLSDGVNAVLLQTASVPDLERALRAILDQHRVLGRDTVRRHAESAFGPSSHAARLDAFLREVVAP